MTFGVDTFTLKESRTRLYAAVGTKQDQSRITEREETL